MGKDKIVPTCNCPHCNTSASILFLSEEDDGIDRNELYCCDWCNESFVIRTGNLVDEWSQELRKMVQIGGEVHENKSEF